MRKKVSRNIYFVVHLLLSGSLVVVVLLLVTMMYASKVYYTETELDDLWTLNDLATATVQEFLGDVSNALMISDYWVKTHPDRDPRFDKDFEGLVNLYRNQMYGLVDLNFLSQSGGLYYIPSENTKPIEDLSDRQYFKAQSVPATRGFYIGAPIISRDTHDWGIPVSIPLSHEVSGLTVLFAFFTAADVESFLESYVINSSGKDLLVRNDGTILITTPFDKNLVGKSLVGKSVWGKLQKGKSVMDPIISDEFDGIPRYVIANPIEDYNLTFISTCSVASVTKPWEEDFRSGIVLIAIVFAIYLAVALFIQKLLRRLDQSLDAITQLSITDTLTGQFNRRHFNDVIHQESLLSARYPQTFTVALMDLDHFKSINDTYGHDAGDQVLVELAHLLRANIRETDTFARWGGEEFIYLFKACDLDGGKLIAEKLRTIVEQHTFPVVGHVTCSFGVASCQPMEDYKAAIDLADQHLYKAKQLGRNCVCGD